jgi:hypothetical protein
LGAFAVGAVDFVGGEPDGDGGGVGPAGAYWRNQRPMTRILKSRVQERVPGAPVSGIRTGMGSDRDPGWTRRPCSVSTVPSRRTLPQLVQLDAVVGGIRQRHIAHVAERGGVRHARRHDRNRSR